MSGHSQDNHSTLEKKPVAFIVPLIFACVIAVAMLLVISIGDPKPNHEGHDKNIKHEGTSSSNEATHEASTGEKPNESSMHGGEEGHSEAH
jgi:hypothetical protein